MTRQRWKIVWFGVMAVLGIGTFVLWNLPDRIAAKALPRDTAILTICRSAGAKPWGIPGIEIVEGRERHELRFNGPRTVWIAFDLPSIKSSEELKAFIIQSHQSDKSSILDDDVRAGNLGLPWAKRRPGWWAPDRSENIDYLRSGMTTWGFCHMRPRVFFLKIYL